MSEAIEKLHDGRRHVHRSLDVHRAIQSCTRGASALYGISSKRTTILRLLGHLWTRKRKRKPSVVRCLDLQRCATQRWKSSFGSGFLPSVFQGVQCRSQGDPVLYASDPPGMSRQMRRQTLDAINHSTRCKPKRWVIRKRKTRISQYELAFRMQTSVPEVMDIRKESEAQCLLTARSPARRASPTIAYWRPAIGRGRCSLFQLFDWGWDFHGTGPQEGIGDGLKTKWRHHGPSRRGLDSRSSAARLLWRTR